MRIVVCLKQIAHTYARSGRDPDSNYLEPEDKVLRINPCDEFALALALEAKEYLPGGAEVSLLTLGPILAQIELVRCLALGADWLFQVDAQGYLDPWQKSSLLARSVQKIEADLVLCGRESLDSANGQTGALLAHHLNMPFVSGVRKIDFGTEGPFAVVRRAAGRGTRQVLRCPLPAVFSVEAGNTIPAPPSYDQKRNLGSPPIQKLVLDAAGVAPRYVQEAQYPPRPRVKPLTPPDNCLDSYGRVSELLSGSSMEKKGRMLTGDPETQVEGIITFLQESGVLEPEKEGELDG